MSIHPLRAASVWTLLAVCAAAAPAAAQTNEELKAELAKERAARLALEARVAHLEGLSGSAAQDPLELQLAGLLPPGELDAASARPPSSPSVYNPQIGVFMDFMSESGNFDSKFDGEADRGLLRETEIDTRLPLSPFATGVAIFSFENKGGGEFDSLVEEGYADVSLGGLFDCDTRARMKVGRMRPKFGRSNQLHLHDWLLANQSAAVRNLLGDEGVVGDGVAFEIPVAHFGGDEVGSGQTTTLDLALVNSDILSGAEGPLGVRADDAGITLTNDGPTAVARLSHFVELGGLADVEVGVSTMQGLGQGSIKTDAGTRVDRNLWGADVTWRSRDDETGEGSWLVQAETIHSMTDFGATGNPGFPVGNQRDSGWWVTGQRQVGQNTYVGLRYGRSDVLGNGDSDSEVSPFISWYADEFFRVRAQIDRLSRDVSGGADINDATRAILQFTWNFGVHQPHPYWTNK